MKFSLSNYWVLLLGLWFVGCRTIEVNSDTKMTIPAQFDYVATQPYEANLAAWWQEWDDPLLTELISTGLKNSNSIKKAQTNIDVAAAYYKISRADLWPMIGASGSANRINGKLTNPILDEFPIDTPSDTDLKMRQVSLISRWELDLFGKNRNAAQAAYYNLLSTQEMFHASQVALSGRIAENYFDAVATQQQIKITDAAIKNLTQLLKYTQARFNSGLANANDIYEVKANISKLRSKQELLLAQFDNVQQTIATLLGKTPQGYRLQYNIDSINKIPPIPTGIQPSDIVYRRPDLLAKQKQIYALAAKTAAAKAELFPSFYLNFGLLDGKIGINSSPKTALTGPLFDVGVKLPIFTAGKIKANIKANEALLQRAIYDYEDSLLNALREIDSAYRTRMAFGNSVTELTNNQQWLNKRASDSGKLFNYGELTYDKVAINQYDFLEASDQLIRQKLNAIRTSILLYQTLGGGWEIPAQKK